LHGSWQTASEPLDRGAIKIGYARVSTPGQNIDLQMRALKAAGCGVIYADRCSGLTGRQDGLRAALARCRPGDELVVWRLDRLSRCFVDLINLYDALAMRGRKLSVLSGRLKHHDADCAEGRAIFLISAALAMLESELIRERTMAGIEAARCVSLFEAFADTA